jgi:hypothetical protein
MFKEKPIRYGLTDMKVEGTKVEGTDTIDYVAISVWRIGGSLLRYSRLSDVVIPYAPLKSDEKFYCSHSSDAVYYLSQKADGKQVLILVYLQNLQYRVIDLDFEGRTPLTDLKNSSIIAENTLICLSEK